MRQRCLDRSIDAEQRITESEAGADLCMQPEHVYSRGKEQQRSDARRVKDRDWDIAIRKGKAQTWRTSPGGEAVWSDLRCSGSLPVHERCMHAAGWQQGWSESVDEHGRLQADRADRQRRMRGPTETRCVLSALPSYSFHPPTPHTRTHTHIYTHNTMDALVNRPNRVPEMQRQLQAAPGFIHQVRPSIPLAQGDEMAQN